MSNLPEPNPDRLASARAGVESFVKRKKRLTTLLFWLAGAAEMVFFVLMLTHMDFASRRDWFLLFGFGMVYTPLIVFSWRNAVKIDHLYYSLLVDLKYGGGEERE